MTISINNIGNLYSNPQTKRLLVKSGQNQGPMRDLLILAAKIDGDPENLSKAEIKILKQFLKEANKAVEKDNKYSSAEIALVEQSIKQLILTTPTALAEGSTLTSEEIPYDFFQTWPAEALTNPSSSLVKLITEVAIEMGLLHELGLRNKKDTVDIIDLNNPTLVKVLIEIEQRRRKVSEVGWAQYKILEATSNQYLDRFTPAERAWVEQYMPPLANLANLMYGLQCHPEHQAQLEWVNENGTIYDIQHYRRIRFTKTPRIKPQFLTEDMPENHSPYRHSIPWMPDSYQQSSTMWPADMTAKEIKRLRKHFDKHDPIFHSYTVVERLRPNQEPPPAIPNQRWIRRLGRKTYVVTSMAVHPRFKASFEEAAALLEASASIEVDGEALAPTFQQYLLTMAASFRSGDMYPIVRAELDQVEGNLNLLFFPHEGYWPDNIKFSMMFGVGLRDPELLTYLIEQLPILQKIEADLIAKAETLGITSIKPSITAADARKLFKLLFCMGLAGFLRAYIPADAAGHDIPRNVPADILGHLIYVFLDVYETANKLLAAEYYNAVLEPEDAARVDVVKIEQITALHENGHGLPANKLSSPTATGRTLGDVFGAYWGMLAEPLADGNAVRYFKSLRARFNNRRRVSQLRCQLCY